MTIKAGDRVKQIRCLNGEPPYAIVIGIKNGIVYHKHEGSVHINSSYLEDFILAPITNWKERVTK